MATVNFKKGLLANLPVTYTEGTFYVTTDERAIYLDVSNTDRVRLGDFQEFANLETLQENTNPSTSALYYVTDINCLAKWNGTGYVQINRDTGMTSVEVSGDGNAVTAAMYDTSGRKLILTKGASYMTASDVDNKISVKVGDLGESETVKAYVDDKVADIVAGSIEGLGALASKDTVSEADLDVTLAAKLNGKADSTQVASDIADAKSALTGTAEDTGTSDTIKGAKKYADEKASEAETAAEAYVDTTIAGLDVSDAAVATQFVSAVSEEDGKISVSRRALVSDDIPEIAQSKVTGLTNALNAKQDSLVFNTAYDADSNKVATMTDVTNAVAGLSGAMHYIGESTTDPVSGATVEGIIEFVKGDVVTYNAKEYVYDGTTWRELGDESSFAVKGSIKDADIAADAAIAQSKIAGLETALAAKATPADITSAINALDVNDEAVAGQIVSAVVETDGKISVSRRALVSDDIPDLAIAKVEGLQTTLDGKAAATDVEALEALVGETSVATQITNAIGALDNSDVAVTNQFVTAVVETNGVISVSRAQPVVADINGLEAALGAAEQNAKNYTDTALAWGSF